MPLPQWAVWRCDCYHARRVAATTSKPSLPRHRMKQWEEELWRQFVDLRGHTKEGTANILVIFFEHWGTHWAGIVCSSDLIWLCDQNFPTKASSMEYSLVVSWFNFGASCNWGDGGEVVQSLQGIGFVGLGNLCGLFSTRWYMVVSTVVHTFSCVYHVLDPESLLAAIPPL